MNLSFIKIKIFDYFFNNTLYKGTKTSWNSTVENPKLFDELDAFISNNKNLSLIHI